METRKGKITGKSLAKASNGSTFATFEFGELRFNTFDAKIIDGFNLDDYVTYNIEKKGNFWNLLSMEKIEEPENGPAEAPIKQPGNGNERFKLTKENIRIGGLEAAQRQEPNFSKEKILELAEEFAEWIENGK